MWLIRVITTLVFLKKNVIMLGKTSVKFFKQILILPTTQKNWKVKVTTWIKKRFVNHVEKSKIQGYHMEFSKSLTVGSYFICTYRFCTVFGCSFSQSTTLLGPPIVIVFNKPFFQQMISYDFLRS